MYLYSISIVGCRVLWVYVQVVSKFFSSRVTNTLTSVVVVQIYTLPSMDVSFTPCPHQHELSLDSLFLAILPLCQHGTLLTHAEASQFLEGLFIVHGSTCVDHVLFSKSFPVLVSSRLFPTFSSIRFSVSVFMLRSVILLDLNFEHDDVDDSIFILLNADIQKIRSYFHCVFPSKFRCSYVYEHMSRSSI